MAEEPSSSAAGPIRISLVAGNHLVFDARDVVRLRREYRLPSALTGTLTQSPQQNAILGLPLQLSAEEARLLVDSGVARVVDERKEAVAAAKLRRERLAGGAIAESGLSVSTEAREPSGAGDSAPPVPAQATATSLQNRGLAGLPLYTFFHGSGHYLTPGLRFGCNFSVYPGDPFRFHSHFLAMNVDWDEPLSVLDITASGRLATGVKKGFVYAAEMPEGASEPGGPRVRAITLEWAGM